MESRFRNFDYKMFDEARKIAETSEFPGFKVGCVLTYKGHIVGKAANSVKTDPMQARFNVYRRFHRGRTPVQHKAHAEILAIKSVSYPVAAELDWSKVNCYTYRVSPGKPRGYGLARPCPACTVCLREKGIKNLFYTTDDGLAMERLEP